MRINNRIYLPLARHGLVRSPVMDLYDRSIIAFSCSTSPSTKVTAKSLADAFHTAQPAPRLMVHTDQEFQYRHEPWHSLLNEHGTVQLMRRKGNCYDDSIIENSFSPQSRIVPPQTLANTLALDHVIRDNIIWYNTQRQQEGLNNHTPTEHRNHALHLHHEHCPKKREPVQTAAKSRLTRPKPPEQGRARQAIRCLCGRGLVVSGRRFRDRDANTLRLGMPFLTTAGGSNVDQPRSRSASEATHRQAFLNHQ